MEGDHSVNCKGAAVGGEEGGRLFSEVDIALVAACFARNSKI